MGHLSKKGHVADLGRAIGGGRIDDTSIGSISPATGTFSDVSVENSLTLNGNRITGLADGTVSGDAATLDQVQAAQAGILTKAPSRVATDADLDTIGNGTWVQLGAGVGATLTAGTAGTTTVDSVVLADGDRVLVKNQGTGSENGIYVASATAIGANTILTRAVDYDGSPSAEVSAGSYTFIEEGTGNLLTGWVLQDVGLTGAAGPPQEAIVDTDSLSFVLLLSGGGGDVFKVGTPANEELGVWTGDGTIGSDTNLSWNGTTLDITGAIATTSSSTLNSSERLYLDGGGDTAIFEVSNNVLRLLAGNAPALDIRAEGTVLTGGALIVERGDHAHAPFAGFGEIWVRSDTPNVLVFTDDAGTDTVLGSGGGGLANIVEDTTPQLGGDLDVNGSSIIGAPAATAVSAGGNLNLYGGTGGATSGDGGWVGIYGGYGATGGYISLTAGAGSTAGGPITLTGGYSEYQNAGSVTIVGGETAADSKYAGNVTITGGDNSYGGSTDTYGGQIIIAGGTAYGYGGKVTITGGACTGTRDAGDVDITSGAGGNYNSAVNIAGSVGSATRDAGIVTISGGAGTAGNADGGNIQLSPGIGAGAGEDGAIVISTSTAPGTTTNKLYNVGGTLTWNAIDLTASGSSLSVVVVTTTSATAGAFQATMVDDDTAAGVVTITLPAGSAADQQVIKKLGTTANVIIDGDSAETIDGALTFTLTAQYASLTLIWNGTEWSII